MIPCPESLPASRSCAVSWRAWVTRRNLAFADQTGSVFRGDFESRRNDGNFHGLADLADAQLEIDLGSLADGKGYGTTVRGLKILFGGGDFVVADRQRGRVESPGFIRKQRTLAACFNISDEHGGARHTGVGGVGDRAPQRRFALSGDCAS